MSHKKPDQTSDELPSHQIVTSVLDRYGTYANILLGPDGSTALHMAAFWANRTALEKIAAHIRTRHAEQRIPWNNKTTRGYTVLDYARHEVGNVKLLRASDTTTLDRMALKTKKEAAIECYRFLRAQGAVHSWELRGNCFA